MIKLFSEIKLSKENDYAIRKDLISLWFSSISKIVSQLIVLGPNQQVSLCIWLYSNSLLFLISWQYSWPILIYTHDYFVIFWNTKLLRFLVGHA